MSAAAVDANFEDEGGEQKGQGLAVVGGSALEAITRGEIDMQVATAKRFPRSISKFKSDAVTMATLDEETAASCFYTLKRAGKVIEGPAVRLAEIVATCWGNIRTQARVIAEDGRFVTAQGIAWDMERNNLASMETQRRITNSKGHTYSDDMIGVTANAAAAIAYRNAVFKIVPNALVRAVYREARKAALGDAKTLVQRRQAAIEWFAKAGISLQQLLAYLERGGIDDIGLEELGILTGTRTAITEGTTTLDETFPPEALKSGTFGFGKKTQSETPAAADKDELADAEKRWADEKAAREAPATAEAPKQEAKAEASPADDKTEPKSKKGKKADEPAPADNQKAQLPFVLAQIAAAKSEDELKKLAPNMNFLATADKPKAMGAFAQRRAELEFADDEAPKADEDTAKAARVAEKLRKEQEFIERGKKAKEEAQQKLPAGMDDGS